MREEEVRTRERRGWAEVGGGTERSWEDGVKDFVG